MKLFLARTVVTIFIYLFSFVTFCNAQVAGETPVAFDVNPLGGLEYSIPLRLPPGIKNMVPDIGISYSSQGGNNILGYGWSITGLSAITRGAPTIFHNQNIKPVDFVDDVYMLDGQRMFETSTGSSTYLTERKNFAIIKSHGTAGSGPAYFTVEHPNGLTFVYGNTIGSAFLASGKTDVLTWAVDSVYDKNGNYIKFWYYNNSSSGDYRIHSIVYGDNANVTTCNPNTIKFYYQDRYDKNEQWVGGSMLQSNALLEKIEILHKNGTIANEYTFVYDTTAYHPRLTEIKEHPSVSDGLEPITINWGNTDRTITVNSSVQNSAIGFGTDRVTGDFNGDGFTDLALFSSQQPHVFTFINNKMGDFNNQVISSYPVPITGTKSPNVQTTPNLRMVFDYNGDGLDDVILINTNDSDPSVKIFDVYLLKANGQSSIFDSVEIIYHTDNLQSDNDNFNTLTHFLPGDFDGDGKFELVIAQPYNFSSTTYVDDYKIFIVGEEYSSVFAPKQIYHFPNGHIDGAMVLDYNGDGKDEFLFNHVLNGTPSSFLYGLMVDYDPSTYKPTLQTQSNNWYVNLFSTSVHPHTHFKNWPGDFNGDGKTDLLSWITPMSYSSPDRFMLAYSDGARNTNTYFNNTPVLIDNSHILDGLNDLGPFSTGSGGYSIHTGDFDGNGFEDILELIETTFDSSKYRVYYSTGSTFIEDTGFVNIDANEEYLSIGDFNGDGRVDILCTAPYSLYPTYKMRFMYFHKNSSELLVTSIEHANKTLSVEYLPIPQDADYTVVARAYPYSDRVLPIRVVKRMYDNVSLDNKYYYKGFVFHNIGLGIRGFTLLDIENKVGQHIYNNYSVNRQFPYLGSIQMYDTLTLSTGLLNFSKITAYRQDVDPGGANGMSKIVSEYQSYDEDILAGLITRSGKQAYSKAPGSPYYEFGQFDYSDAHATGYTTGGIHEINTFTYDMTQPFINRMKPKSITRSYKAPDATPQVDSSIYSYDNTTGQLLTSTSNPSTSNQKTIEYSYDNFGNVISTELTGVNIAGSIINEFGYTSDGRFMDSSTNAMGYVSVNDYGGLTESWGNVLQTTGINGLQVDYEYDEINRLEKTTDLTSGVEVTTTYDWASNSTHATSLPHAQMVVTTETSGIQGASISVIDKYGRTIREVSTAFDGSDVYSDKEYTENDLLAVSRGVYPAGNPSLAVTTTYEYDTWSNEIKRTTSPGNVVITQEYTGDHLGMGGIGGYGERTIINQTTNEKRIYKYFGQYNMKITGTATGTSVNDEIVYQYHGNGKVKQTSHNTSSTVDSFGRIKTSTDSSSGTTVYVYNALDQVVKETWPDGTEYEYTYDVLGRVIEKQEVGQPASYIYTYNNTPGQPSTGKLLSEISPNGTDVYYTYNSRGELITKDESLQGGTITFTTEYTYDNYGRTKTHTYPSGDEITYHYTQYGDLERVELTGSTLGLPSQNLWQVNSRNHLGQLTEAQYYSPSFPPQPIYTATRTYDALGNPANRTLTNISSGNAIADADYTFNLATGNLTQRTDNLNTRGFTEDFTYDAYYDRLTGISNTGTLAQTQSIEYKENGNISKKSDVSNSSYAWIYNKYALEKVPEPQTSTPVPYEIPQNTLITEYNSIRKVSRISENGENEVLLTYNSNGERIKAEYYDISMGNQLIKTKYYASNYELIEDAGTGDLEHISYIWGAGELIGILYHKVPAGPSIKTSNVYYTHTDYLGSITHILDNLGTTNNGLVEERSYDAWGRVRDPQTWVPYVSNSFPNWMFDRGYTGHEHIRLDTWNNNIINMNGRLYDPLVGRMFSPDPVITNTENTQDYNKYSYARNNPLKYTDPSGYTVSGMMSYEPVSKTSTGQKLVIIGLGVAGGVAGGIVGAYVASALGASAGTVTVIAAMTSTATSSAVTTAYAGGDSRAVANAALMGAVYGGMFGLGTAYNEVNITYDPNKHISHSEGSKVPGDFSDYKKIADAYERSLGKRFYDKLAVDASTSEFPTSAKVMNGGITTSPGNYGMTTDGIFVSNDMRYVYAYTEHYSAGKLDKLTGFNTLHISRYVLDHYQTQYHYYFKAIVGHEMIHGIHWRVFGSPNPAFWYKTGKFQSEIAAYKYSHSIYLKANDFINADFAYDRMQDYLRQAGGKTLDEFLFLPKL